MLLSSPQARLLTFSKTRLIKFHLNCQLMTDPIHLLVEESAYRVLTNEGPNNTHIAGVPIVIHTYDLHKDNAEVVESIVTLLMELAEYGNYFCLITFVFEAMIT